MRARSPYKLVGLTLTTTLLALSSIDCGDDSATSGTTSSSSTGGGVACTLGDASEETPPAPPLHTPRWAFEPWISKDISDGPDTYAFVEGFEQRGIPVGAVVLDSPWETNYNTLVPNPKRYPNFAQMVSDLHAKNIRIVLWTTAFVNESSFDLEPAGDLYTGPADDWEAARDCGFFVDGGTSYGWWKGQGGSVDFFNPRALAWWHRRQDPLFEMGVDGFKLDFGDSYLRNETVETAAGTVTHQAYSEAYYHDFYAYGRKARGDDFVTMVRAWDTSYGLEARFHARREDAPVVWMGDNRRDYVGLVDMLDHMFISANAGYAVLGSDIGGYLDRDDLDIAVEVPFDKENFARWTAIGALSPFMQLHGRANLTPWTIEQNNDEIVDLYRYWSMLHHELVPFFYSLTKETYAGKTLQPVRPIGEAASWPDDYRYMLGDAFLVAPILDASGIRDVTLPAGASYYDFWSPLGDPLLGGQTLTNLDFTDFSRVPLFVKSGAIIPMVVDNDLTGFGDASSAGKNTFAIYPGATMSTFVVHDEDDLTTSVTAISAMPGGFSLSFSRRTKETILRVRTDTPITALTLDATPLTSHATRAALNAATSGWFYDAAIRSVWVKIAAGAAPATIAGT